MHTSRGENMTDPMTQEKINYASELKHLDEIYQAELAAYQEANEHKQALLDELGPKLEKAKSCFYQINEQHGGDIPDADPQLDELLDDVRYAFKRFDMKTSNGGPPLA